MNMPLHRKRSFKKVGLLPTGPHPILLFILLTALILPGSLFANAYPGQDTISVSGTVSESGGPAIPGVNVVLKNSGKGTITDMDGKYTLEGVPANGTLVFSSIGMGTVEEPINGREIIDVELTVDDILLDEVVVVGYGVQKKSDITGSISSVDEEQMLKIPTTDIAQMLVGRVAGLEVISATGRPGEFSSIRIRGTRSLSGGNSPLYVVDGVPMESIDFINPADIKSLEVLKDASSTAIYGARAANGVVLVTTKRGEAGVSTINVSGTHTTQILKRNFEFYNPLDYALLQKEKYRRPDGTYPSNEVIFPTYELENFNNKEYTDWEDLTISDAVLQRYDLNMTTGTENSKMLFSVGVYDQDGMIDNSAYQQLNTRLNADYKIFESLSLGANFSYTYSDRDIEEDNVDNYLSLSPLVSPFDEEGNLVPVTGDGGQDNPLWNNREYYKNERKHQYLVNIFADWEILPKLTYRLNTSLNGSIGRKESYRTSLHQIGSNTNGTGELSANNQFDVLLENILNYSLKTWELGVLDLTLVQSANQVRYENLSVGATNFPTDQFGVLAIGGALDPGQPSVTISNRRILSYMGRANYNFLEKYLLSATIRMDGSSVFGDNDKWAYLPSFAAGWLVHREAFMENITWLSRAKLRLSYGKVGNQAVQPYRTLGVVNEYFYKFGEEDASYAALPSGELYNPNLRWEVSQSTNLGLELAFLKNRITVDAEIYNTDTKDLIVNRTIDASLGYTNMYDNLGIVQNRGVEVTVGYDVLRAGDLSWNLNANFSANRNEIKRITGEVDEDGNPLDDIGNNWFIGQPINVYNDYEFEGIWQLNDDIANSHMPDAEPGDVRVRDIDNNGEINSDDRIILLKDPKFIASLTSQMEYKGFDLSLDFFLKYGGVKYNSKYGGGLGSGSSNAMNVGYWTPESPSNVMPRPRLTYIYNISTLQYQDASYLRLRNLTVGYTLPQKVLERAGLKQLRVFTSLTNYWTITQYLSYGPEHGAGSYPEPKTLQFGANLTF